MDFNALEKIHRSGMTAEQIMDAEFMLDVESKLGPDLPEMKLRLLIMTNRLARDRMKQLVAQHLLFFFMPRWHARKVNDLNRRLLFCFATILSPEEFKSFTGLDSPDSTPDAVDPQKMG